VQPKVKVVLVQRRGEVERLYASEPVELMYLDWATDADVPERGAVLAKIESARSTYPRRRANARRATPRTTTGRLKTSGPSR